MTPEDSLRVGLAATIQRHRGGSSLAEIARSSGLSIGYVARLEKGLRMPSLLTITRLASALGLTPARFVAEATDGRYLAEKKTG